MMITLLLQCLCIHICAYIILVLTVTTLYFQSKSKCSPSSTPLLENKHLLLPSKPATQVLIEEITEPVKKIEEPVKKAPTPEENWRDGVGENVTVIKTVKKPPHLRSKVCKIIKTIYYGISVTTYFSI